MDAKYRLESTAMLFMGMIIMQAGPKVYGPSIAPLAFQLARDFEAERNKQPEFKEEKENG